KCPPASLVAKHWAASPPHSITPSIEPRELTVTPRSVALFRDIPECGKRQPAIHAVLAIGDRLFILAEPDMGSDVDCPDLHLLGQLHLLLCIVLVCKGIAEPFHLRIAWPPRRGSIAIGRQESRGDRIEHIDCSP